MTQKTSSSSQDKTIQDKIVRDQVQPIVKLDPLIVKNSLNARHFPTHKEINNLPSMTIPDQSLKIKEILVRYAQGLPMHSNHQTPIYNGEGYLPDFKTMDISEIADMREFMKHKISAARERLYTEAENARLAKEKEYEDFLQERQKQKEHQRLSEKANTKKDEVNNKNPNT